MATILVVFESKHGHAADIAAHVTRAWSSSLRSITEPILEPYAGLPTDTGLVHDLTDWKTLDGAVAPFLDRFVPPADDANGAEHSGVHRIVKVATASSFR